LKIDSEVASLVEFFHVFRDSFFLFLDFLSFFAELFVFGYDLLFHRISHSITYTQNSYQSNPNDGYNQIFPFE